MPQLNLLPQFTLAEQLTVAEHLTPSGYLHIFFSKTGAGVYHMYQVALQVEHDHAASASCL